MCSIIGAAARVVDAGGFTIDELAGNVATKDDQLSIAYVKAAAGTAEPWLTLHYDEWICVRSGMAVFSQEGLPDIEASAGQTIHLPPGTRFQPSFPVDTEYIPVCLPAFRPDRCVREDVTDEGAAVAAKLNELHDQDTTAATPEEAAVAAPKEEAPEVLFHMTTVDEWTAAQTKGVYYPKTFEADGHYTHATGVPSRLLTTANHFYQDVPGAWVCLQFTRTALRDAGIFVKDEEALPVGDKPVSADWVASNWVCPHVIGGIPAAVVEKEYPMIREGTSYVAIESLC